MPGNRSRYSIERSHAETLKLWGIPEWWNLNKYDQTRQWTATRWLVEINFRRRFYNTSRKYFQTWISYNEETSNAIVKTFYDCIDYALSYDQKTLPDRYISREVDGYEIGVYLTPLIKDVMDQINKLRFIVEDCTMSPDEKILLMQKWCPDVVTKRNVEHSFISVDLIGWSPAIKASFNLWLEEKKPSKMGRPTSSIGPQQFRAWAREYYLAYLDLRELIKLQDKPLPTFSDWDALLTRKIDIGKADWLLSDEANGLLRVAAETEGYLLTSGYDQGQE